MTSELMSNRALLGTMAVVAVLAVGFSLGVHFAAPAPIPPESPREIVKVVHVPDEDTRRDVENYNLRRQVTALQQKVEVARSAASAREVEAEPRLPPPVEFPRDVPRSSLPDGFREVLAETIKTCGMGLEVAKVDCTEYPCVAWTKATDPSVHVFSMSRCGAWKTAFPHGERVVGKTVHSPDGSVTRYFAWMPMPEDEAREDVMKRFGQRRELAEHELGIEN
jgi:hypothetical protein